MIRVKVREEDRLDLLGFDTGLDHPAHGSDAAVNQILAAIDDEQRRGFRTIPAQRRPSSRAKKNYLGASVWICDRSAPGSIAAAHASQCECGGYERSKHRQECGRSHETILRHR